jgi:diacylglycerol kinase (ATP)
MNPKRATIIYNPMSGRPGRRAEDVREMIRLLSQRGIDSDARATTGPEDAARLATEALTEGASIIISYGGDGTINEVIQEMAGTDAALAIWPGGTSNVVARDLGVPFQLTQVADMIAAGRTRRIALGLAKSGDGETRRQGDTATVAPSPSRPVAPSRYFVMMAGIGLDASIAQAVNKKLKRRTGEFAYWLSGIRHFFMWHGEPFTIEVDGHRYESAFALVGNGKGYGGGMVMTPNAKLEEPWFEVYIVPLLRNNFAYLRALRACMRGKPEVPGVLLIKGKHVVANSAHEPWVEADGEIIGPLPMTFDIVPDALSVIVP